MDERPRYAHLVGNNPWVKARQETEARSAASEASDTGELPVVRIAERASVSCRAFTHGLFPTRWA